MNTMTPSQDDEIIEHIDEHDETTDAEYAGGTNDESMTLPDQGPKAEMVEILATAVAQAIRQERENYAARRKGYLENQAGSDVLMQRYSVPIGMPIQIAREKSGRSRVMIMAIDEDGVSIGIHAGILANGTDTVTANTATAIREIQTTEALWAVSNHATNPIMIDVLEEFI